MLHTRKTLKSVHYNVIYSDTCWDYDDAGEMLNELNLRKPHFQGFASAGSAADSECLLKFCV